MNGFLSKLRWGGSNLAEAVTPLLDVKHAQRVQAFATREKLAALEGLEKSGGRNADLAGQYYLERDKDFLVQRGAPAPAVELLFSGLKPADMLNRTAAQERLRLDRSVAHLVDDLVAKSGTLDPTLGASALRTLDAEAQKAQLLALGAVVSANLGWKVLDQE